MYLIAASPLAKIFQPECQKALRADLSLMWKEESPFKISIQRSHGVYNFHYGQPRLFQTSGDKLQIDYEYFIEWLVGGESGVDNRETDIYGIVKLPVQDEIMGVVAGLINNPSGKMQKEIQPLIQDGMKKARELANKRVMTAIQRVYNNYEQQCKAHKEMKLGDYAPSVTEVLCTYAMKDILTAKNNEDAGMIAEMAKMREIINQSMVN